MNGRSLGLCLGLLASAGLAAAGGVRDLDDAWLVPREPLQTLLSLAPSSRSPWSVTLAQGRLYDLAELPQLGLTVGGAWPRCRCRLSWERLGRTLYQEDRYRLDALVGGPWSVGAQLGLDRLDLGEPEPRLAPDAQLRLRGHLPGDAVLDVWWPLTDAPVWYGAGGLRRWLRLTGGAQGRVWAVAADRTAGGTPTFQGELMLRAAPMVAIGLRFEPWSRTMGLVTAWSLGSLMLRSSHLVHPDLGPSHRWSLTIGGRP